MESQLAGDSGPFFHDDQLLLLLGPAPWCWSAVPPYPPAALIVAEMAANRQRRQQDAVLTMRI